MNLEFVEFTRLEMEEITFSVPKRNLQIITRSTVPVPGKKCYSDAFRDKIFDKYGLQTSVTKGPNAH